MEGTDDGVIVVGDSEGGLVDTVGEGVGEVEGLDVGALHTPQALGQPSLHALLVLLLHSSFTTLGLAVSRNPQVGGSSSK